MKLATEMSGSRGWVRVKIRGAEPAPDVIRGGLKNHLFQFLLW
jgi:hypothetical protein